MYEDFAPKLARLITEYSQPIQPGNVVEINSQIVGKPLVIAMASFTHGVTIRTANSGAFTMSPNISPGITLIHHALLLASPMTLTLPSESFLQCWF